MFRPQTVFQPVNTSKSARLRNIDSFEQQRDFAPPDPERMKRKLAKERRQIPHAFPLFVSFAGLTPLAPARPNQKDSVDNSVCKLLS